MRPLALLLAPLLLASAPAPSPTAAPPLAFLHVTTIDATGAPSKPDQTVVVQNGQIAAIGRTGSLKIPAGARVIDAAGKYLIPGLWDMHTHLGERETALPLLYLAAGVTGVRDMGSSLDLALKMREQVERAQRTGPRIVTAGVILDNAPLDWPFRRKVSNAEEARQAVADLQRRGVDFLKVHNSLPRDAYFAIAEEARRRGLAFAGHVPLAVTLTEAIQAGQASIEHLNEFRLLAACPPAATAGERCRDLFAQLREKKVWQTPTLVALRNLGSFADPELANDPRLKYVPAPLRSFWDKFFAEVKLSPQQIAAFQVYYREALGFVGSMHRAGVPILAGTDVGVPYILPGFSIHDELHLLVQAGLSPLAALQTATRNPAQFLGRANLGTIEPGKIADLVLLDADPLADIRNTRKIAAVVARGRLYDRKALDQMLVEAVARARRE